MNAYLIEASKEVMQQLKQCLDDQGEEVVTTLQRVALGELKLIETLSADEIECARELFGWVAQEGPQKVWAKVEPLLPELMAAKDEVALDDIFDDPGFGDLPPALKKLRAPHTLARLAVLLASYIDHDAFHYPQPQTGVYDLTGTPLEKLKWVYRYWFNQLEVAELGSGLEEFFASQRFKFFNLTDPSPDADGTGPHVPSVSVSCAGDLLAVDVLTPDNTPHLFDAITDFYSNADIVSANLKSTVFKKAPIGRSQEEGEPAKLNTCETMLHKFRDEARINFFSTATNHAMDYGEAGVQATLDAIRASGALCAGTAASQAEQDDVVLFEKNGIKVALLAYTFDLNGNALPSDKPYLANQVRFNDVSPPPNYSLIKKQVAAAQAKGAHWIIAYCHWGWEFEMYPHTTVVDAAHKVIECGVDTILGNYPHVSQPAQLIPRSGKQDALVVYALGDFVSYQPASRNSKLAYSIKFDIGQVQGKTRLFNLQALALYLVNENLGNGLFDCRIVKFFDVLQRPNAFGLTELEKSQLPHLRDKVWNDILSPLSSIAQRFDA